MKTFLSWVFQLAAVAAAGFGAFTYFTKQPAEGPAADPAQAVQEATLNLQVATLTPVTVTPEYTSLAMVEEWQSSTLATQASGRVVWTCACFEQGQVVEAGTKLLSIDAISYNRDVVERQKDLGNAIANLTAAEAETEQARANYARLELGEPNDIALKIPERDAARLAVTAAEAALAIAQDKLNETNVVAPYTGLISRVGVTTGDLIGNGANLGTIVGTEVFKVRFPILENQLSLAQIGAEITVETTTQPVIVKSGIVRAIDVNIDAATRLNSVIVAVQNPLEGEVLRIGRFVNGSFIGQPFKDVFAVPLIALDNEMNYYQIGPDSRLTRSLAEPVYRDFSAVYIDAGGRIEMEIITGNALGLRAGMLAQGYGK